MEHLILVDQEEEVHIIEALILQKLLKMVALVAEEELTIAVEEKMAVEVQEILLDMEEVVQEPMAGHMEKAMIGE